MNGEGESSWERLDVVGIVRPGVVGGVRHVIPGDGAPCHQQVADRLWYEAAIGYVEGTVAANGLHAGVGTLGVVDIDAVSAAGDGVGELASGQGVRAREHVLAQDVAALAHTYRLGGASHISVLAAGHLSLEKTSEGPD